MRYDDCLIIILFTFFTLGLVSKLWRLLNHHSFWHILRQVLNKIMCFFNFFQFELVLYCLTKENLNTYFVLSSIWLPEEDECCCSVLKYPEIFCVTSGGLNVALFWVFRDLSLHTFLHFKLFDTFCCQNFVKMEENRKWKVFFLE